VGLDGLGVADLLSALLSSGSDGEVRRSPVPYNIAVDEEDGRDSPTLIVG